MLPFSCCLCLCARLLIEIELQSVSSAVGLSEYRAAAFFVKEYPVLHLFTLATAAALAPGKTQAELSPEGYRAAVGRQASVFPCRYKYH